MLPKFKERFLDNPEFKKIYDDFFSVEENKRDPYCAFKFIIYLKESNADLFNNLWSEYVLQCKEKGRDPGKPEYIYNYHEFKFL